MRKNAKIPRWTGGRGPPGSLKIGIFGPKNPGDPSDDLGRSFGIIFSPKFQHPTIFVNNFHVFLEKYFFEKHENRTFRASLEPWGPRDPPYVQERQILFRIALTRALYDQTAPQLSSFYVPGHLGLSPLVFLGFYRRVGPRRSPPEGRETPVASVLVTKSIGSLPPKHFPSFRW